jgi:xyloglucan-specific exo-beta-1,4-glucanase
MSKSRLKHITLLALIVMFLAVPGFPGPKQVHAAVTSESYTFNSVNTGAGGGYVDGKGDVWKLNTATGVWTNISPVPSSSSNNFFGYGGIAVDAQHPDTLVVATLNAWWPDEQFYRSI